MIMSFRKGNNIQNTLKDRVRFCKGVVGESLPCICTYVDEGLVPMYLDMWLPMDHLGNVV